MQQFLLTNNWVYLIGFLVSFLIMLLTDYILGEEAEYLNAWSIICHWIQSDTKITSSFIMNKYGLLGATFIMLLANILIGSLLVLSARTITQLLF